MLVPGNSFRIFMAPLPSFIRSGLPRATYWPEVAEPEGAAGKALVGLASCDRPSAQGLPSFGSFRAPGPGPLVQLPLPRDAGWGWEGACLFPLRLTTSSCPPLGA